MNKKYYNDNNIDVTKRIEKKRTYLFLGTDLETMNKANKKALSIGSYPYEVYANNEYDRKVFVGFGVPR